MKWEKEKAEVEKKQNEEEEGEEMRSRCTQLIVGIRKTWQLLDWMTFSQLVKCSVVWCRLVDPSGDIS